MPFNASDFWSNPIGNIIAPYTDVLGVFFYGFVLFMVMGYVLMKTESWASASVIGLFIGICFSLVLPELVLIVIGILAVFVLASVIVDVVVL